MNPCLEIHKLIDFIFAAKASVIYMGIGMAIVGLTGSFQVKTRHALLQLYVNDHMCKDYFSYILESTRMTFFASSPQPKPQRSC